MKHLYIDIIVAIAAISIFSGCRNESYEPQGAINQNSVYTRWGAAQSEVMAYMDNDSMAYMDNGFICYNGEGNIKTISYRLENDSLVEALIIMPEEGTTLEDVQKSFGNYEHLGERNNADVYVNKGSNTIVTISRETYSGISYYAVGYAALDKAADRI